MLIQDGVAADYSEGQLGLVIQNSAGARYPRWYQGWSYKMVLELVVQDGFSHLAGRWALLGPWDRWACIFLEFHSIPLCMQPLHMVSLKDIWTSYTVDQAPESAEEEALRPS